VKKVVGLLKFLNRRFKPVVHPFNLSNDGVMTYAEWQYEKGGDTINFYLAFTDTDTMFSGKTVLDIGCGAGGKTLYYASLGAEKVVGVEILEKYRAEAEALAAKIRLSDRFEFVCADASGLPFAEGTFDTVVMNDAMEHVDAPEAALAEVLRVLKTGGRVYINFPPYNHPFGAHLSDVIFIPWVHRFFTRKTLIRAYKDLTAGLPDGEGRVAFRISKDERGREVFSYINKMTLRRYKRILKKLRITPVYYTEVPLRGVLKLPAKLPVLREFFVKMAVCVIEKSQS
jgi:SAM-dependent methyltransferase